MCIVRRGSESALHFPVPVIQQILGQGFLGGGEEAEAPEGLSRFQQRWGPDRPWFSLPLPRGWGDTCLVEGQTQNFESN